MDYFESFVGSDRDCLLFVVLWVYSSFHSGLDLLQWRRRVKGGERLNRSCRFEVVAAALRAARRVHDYATAVRVFEGLKVKVENAGQYNAYLQELSGIREELGEFFWCIC